VKVKGRKSSEKRRVTEPCFYYAKLILFLFSRYIMQFLNTFAFEHETYINMAFGVPYNVSV